MKKVKELKETTNRRIYNLVYEQLIHWDCCWICSKRRGYWCDCWNDGRRDYDNPLKSWKYKSKKKRQYL